MEWTDWPKHLRHFLLPVLPPEVEQLHSLRHQANPDLLPGPAPLPPPQCHLFTDGSATRHTYTPLTCASWSVIMAPGHDHYPIVSGRLPGVIQSPARAEACALLQATRWAVAHHVQVTDCQPALQRVEHILQGQEPCPTWANYGPPWHRPSFAPPSSRNRSTGHLAISGPSRPTRQRTIRRPWHARHGSQVRVRSDRAAATPPQPPPCLSGAVYRQWGVEPPTSPTPG